MTVHMTNGHRGLGDIPGTIIPRSRGMQREASHGLTPTSRGAGHVMMSSLVNSVHDLTAWCGMTSSQDLSTGKQSRYNKICNLESF